MKRRSQDDEVSEARAGQAPPAAAGRNRPPLLDPGTWFLRRFRVERLLGQGGMGAVYAVADKGQIWALKIVRSEFLDDPDQRRRLLREGEVLARMRHPNVVQVHEVGLADDLTAWYRMELLDGVTLRDELRRRRALSLPLACATLRAAALGAGHLHSFGGVHRDVKPENLFILREPRDVKLLDFGLARLSGTPDTLDAQTHGSPLFMAPEQIRDEVPTPATDVYALGLIAYEAIAGFHPFGDARAAGRIDALFARHLHEVPPPLSRIGVPEPISGVIARAIAKVPRERHRDGLAFAEALWDPFLVTRHAQGARDTNPGEPEISEILRWGNEEVATTTGPAAPARSRERIAGASSPAAAPPGRPGGAAPRDPQAGRRQAGGEAEPGQAGSGWAMTERLPERLRDPSCVAALAQRAPDPPPAPEPVAPGWVPVEHTVPLARTAAGAGAFRPGAVPFAGGGAAGTGRTAAPVGPVAARPEAASAHGAAVARRRVRITPRAVAIGLSLGVVVSLLLLDVILRLQGAPPVASVPVDPVPAALAASALAPAAPGPTPGGAGEAVAPEPSAVRATVEDASAAHPATVPSAGARAEEPPAAVPAGARRSGGGMATTRAPAVSTPVAAAAMPATAVRPAARAVAPTAPPPAARPKPKPRRRQVVRDPRFYDEFLE
ncbi:protein kinase [Sorangium sp. So ce1014]|uniref:serine/threonine-protein kinase n=1 Tax=Sorangium sp. So ce1014 TaxID=3133326 RepID=UPI003F6481AE